MILTARNQLMRMICCGLLWLAVMAAEAQINIWEGTACRKKVEMTPYVSEGTGNVAVVVCPGGSFFWHDMQNEGHLVGQWLQKHGVSAFVLRYRTAYVPAFVVRHRWVFRGNRYPDPQDDLRQALKCVRANAEKWGIDPELVGAMGFSAGGHLVSTLMVSDDASIRPDYAILFYPIVSMKKELTHYWAYLHLLGENPSKEMEDRYSNELHISNLTPPAYIVVCSDDKIVDPRNAIRFYKGMRAHNRPVTLQVYPSGGHGWGYRLTFAHHRQMVDDLSEWLKNRPSKLHK